MYIADFGFKTQWKGDTIEPTRQLFVLRLNCLVFAEPGMRPYVTWECDHTCRRGYKQRMCWT